MRNESKRNQWIHHNLQSLSSHMEGADIPDSESLVLVPLSDAKIQPSAKFARAPADSDGVRLDSTSAAGVLSLFPDGGRVFPIGKKRRFRLDLVSGRENDTDGMVG